MWISIYDDYRIIWIGGNYSRDTVYPEWLKTNWLSVGNNITEQFIKNPKKTKNIIKESYVKNLTISNVFEFRVFGQKRIRPGYIRPSRRHQGILICVFYTPNW